MTIEQFLDQLRETSGPWVLQEPLHQTFGSMIRRETGGSVCCPITALGGGRFTSCYPRDALMMGLSDEDARKIATTADGMLTHEDYDPELRKQLLQATVER